MITARDAFAFLLASATAMRRSEITGLSVAQAQPVPADRLWVRPRRAKTDPAGAEAVLAGPFGTHPVTCVPYA